MSRFIVSAVDLGRIAFALLPFPFVMSAPLPSPADPASLTRSPNAALPAFVSSVSSPRLEGITWLLIELNGVAIAAKPGTRAGELSFDRERMQISASGGCNGLGGSYERTADALTIVPGVSTMMACMSPLVMQREEAFVRALRATTAFRLTGKLLVLLDGDRVIARFRAEK